MLSVVRLTPAFARKVAAKGGTLWDRISVNRGKRLEQNLAITTR